MLKLGRVKAKLFQQPAVYIYQLISERKRVSEMQFMPSETEQRSAGKASML